MPTSESVLTVAHTCASSMHSISYQPARYLVCLCEIKHRTFPLTFRFNKEWLKNKKYHKEDNIKADKMLSALEKNILLGIHRRHMQCADRPSSMDYEFLSSCYKKRMFCMLVITLHALMMFSQLAATCNSYTMVVGIYGSKPTESRVG